MTNTFMFIVTTSFMSLFCIIRKKNAYVYSRKSMISSGNKCSFMFLVVATPVNKYLMKRKTFSLSLFFSLA